MVNEKVYNVHSLINDTDRGCMTCGEKQKMHFNPVFTSGCCSQFDKFPETSETPLDPPLLVSQMYLLKIFLMYCNAITLKIHYRNWSNRDGFPNSSSAI